MNNYDRDKLRRELKELTNWIYVKFGINTNFAADGANQYNSDTKIITINTKMNLLKQLHILIHEAGHVQVEQSANYHKRFPLGYNNLRSKAARVDMLREEILAWEAGLEVASEAGIAVEHARYNHHLQESIYSYVKYIDRPLKWWHNRKRYTDSQ